MYATFFELTYGFLCPKYELKVTTIFIFFGYANPHVMSGKVRFRFSVCKNCHLKQIT